MDSIFADYKVEQLIDDNYRDLRRYNNSAKAWTRTNKDLMNMSVSALTTKREIRKVYRS